MSDCELTVSLISIHKLNTFHYLLSTCYLNVILSVYRSTMHIFNIHSDKHLRIWQENSFTADNSEYVL